MSKKNAESNDSLTTDDIKSFWNILHKEVKEKYDVDLNKWVGQIVLILALLIAVSTILAWNIGSGVETKSDIQSDSGNYNIKSDVPNTRPSGGDADSGGMVSLNTRAIKTDMGVFNISSQAVQSTSSNSEQQSNSGYSKSGYTAVQTTTGIADMLTATIGSTTSMFVMLAIVGVATSFFMGALFQISRVLGLR